MVDDKVLFFPKNLTLDLFSSLTIEQHNRKLLEIEKQAI